MQSENCRSAPAGAEVTTPQSAPDSGAVADTTYQLDAEMTFDGPALVLAPTLSACPDARFRLSFQAATETTSPLYASVSGGDDDQVLAAMAADDTVRDPVCVSRFETESIYRVRPASEAVDVVAMAGDLGGYVRHCRGTATGWTVRMHLPTRETLRELNGRCAERDVSVDVSHLSDLRAATAATETTLSSDQRELLVAAEDHGYFEVPRGISQRELAARFDVTPSAISQQLRTAIGTLVAGTLAGN
ncbi:bacterio-opsin activator domain-containing protein [Halobacteriales archaeon Cl-PHB]